MTVLLLIKDDFVYKHVNLQISIPANTILIAKKEDQHGLLVMTQKYIRYRYGENLRPIDIYYSRLIQGLNSNNIKYKELTFVDLWEMKRNGNSFSS